MNKNMILYIKLCVIPDEEYVDINGWVNEDCKGEKEEESPLESCRCLSLTQFGVLQADLHIGLRKTGRSRMQKGEG